MLRLSAIILVTLSALPALCAQEDVSVHRMFSRLYAVDSPEATAKAGYTILPRAARAAGLTREVFGYFPYWFRTRWNLLDYRLVSTIAYFSGEANADGTIGSTRGWPRYPGDPTASADVINMINAAHASGVRVVLCITNFEPVQIHMIVSDTAATRRFIQETLALVQAGGGDGININFEGIASADRDAVTAFMRALADSFHTRMPGSQVSCAPTDFDTRAGDWDIAALEPTVDLFFFQGYGYGYGGSSTTRPVGLLPNTSFWGSLNITTFVNYILARIPPTKAVLGVPHFGYRWAAASGDPKAATQGDGVPFYYPDALGYTATYGRRWDALALNPWFRYQVGTQWYQGWYDDPESMSHKYQFVLDRNLMGVGMWALGMDGANHEIWDVLEAYFADSTIAPRPPSTPVLALVRDVSQSSGGRVEVRWTALPEPMLGGFQVRLIDDRQSVVCDTLVGPAVRTFVCAGLSNAAFYSATVTAVDTTGLLKSGESDLYATITGGGRRYLVVDGFDRTTASYANPRHTFASIYAEALLGNDLRCDAADNDAVIAGTVPLSDYDGVVWFLGDESVADRTFNQAEQALLRAYMEEGGRLFVSGSEVGYDLGRADSPNANLPWYSAYLKASYGGDKAMGTAFTGVAYFAGLSGSFGETYPEDYPDYVAPAGGAQSVLQYNTSQVAGVAYAGPFGSGTNAGAIVYIGFPFETIGSGETRRMLMGRIVDYLEGILGVTAGEELPGGIVLNQNFPNPFNPTTVISFQLPVASDVRLVVYDILGREVDVLVDENRPAGRHEVTFDASRLASGVYVYRLTAGERVAARKMVLAK